MHRSQTRYVRQPEASYITALPKSTMYLAISRGEFPKPIKISKRAVAWDLAELEAWLAARKQAA